MKYHQDNYMLFLEKQPMNIHTADLTSVFGARGKRKKPFPP